MSHTLESVKARIEQLKVSDLMFAGKEVKALPSILDADEVLLAVTKGLYKKGIGLLCATQKRILFINKGIFSLKVEEFPLKSLSSISSESGVIFAKVKIFASGNNAEIEQAPKEDAKRLVNEMRTLMGQREKSAEVAPIKSEPDIYEQLEKLAALKDKGIITDEEFQAKKSQILSS